MKHITLPGTPLLPQAEKDSQDYPSISVAHYIRRLLEDNIELIKSSFDGDDIIIVDPFTHEVYGSKWVGGTVDSLAQAIKNYPMKRSI